MPDYKATSRTISTRQRTFRIVVEQPKGQTPRMEFLEEVVRNDAGEETTTQVPGCSLTFLGADVIDLRNPANDNLTGKTLTQQELYIALYSAYRKAADIRDAAVIP